jgi:hypothetical protein
MINDWAKKWGVPLEAVQDLTNRLTVTTSHPAGRSEAAVQQEIRLETSRRGARLFRNNNGACKTDTGRQVRYGLGNDSSQVNSVLKSSDLIGITPVTIAGRRVGVFTSYEIKRPGWHYTGDTREHAQLRWLELITSLGGIARFITSVEDL